MSGTSALFQLLRDGRPRTRAELVSETRLARSTVSEHLETLLASGFLKRADTARSTGGRPPTTFAINHAARAVLAVDIGVTHAHLAVTDLSGRILVDEEHELDVSSGPDTVLADVCHRGRALVRRSGYGEDELIGVGVGLPGPVEHATGRPTRPPLMPGWDGFDVPGFVHEHLSVPTLVDNDVNVMTVGEQRTQWPEVPNLLYVKVATGIGSGLMTDGHLHRGAQGAAGDMGHVQVPHSADVPCHCGNVGCLEAIAGGAALAARLNTPDLPVTTSAELVELARGGSAGVLKALRQAGRDIGDVLATAVSLFNPSVIVIGGSLSQAGEQLIAGVREVVYQRSLPLATQDLRIVRSRAGERAGVVGAAVMVIDDLLAPANIDSQLSRGGASVPSR
nr:ROK family transcriptional regulator [Haloactinopolyspora alba]